MGVNNYNKKLSSERQSKDAHLQNSEIIAKTIQLTELKGLLEDKNIELEKANRELQKQNRELIRKTIDLTELKSQLEDKNIELENANREILDLLKVRTEFMNQAAHDLRTPLTPIITLLPIIKSEAKGEKMRHNIAVVENNANYLNQILKELLSLIRSDSADLENKNDRISIKKIIDEVLSNEENIFKIHKIKVAKAIEPKLPDVRGSRMGIIEVIQNIISNAVKFMPKKGKIAIAATKKDNFIYVSVKDSGIGMSRKTIEKLFVPFFKADESRHIEGSGLGLSICKKIIGNHNGSIAAESGGLGKGSTITFTLPISKS